MGERQQITYMQVRIVRMACRGCSMSMRDVIGFFVLYDVLGYIERNFGLFHMEGDNAVFEDVCVYLCNKGTVLPAEFDPKTLVDDTIRTLGFSEENAMCLVATMVAEQVAKVLGISETEALEGFLASEAGRQLFMPELKLWWDGPAYVADTYLKSMGLE